MERCVSRCSSSGRGSRTPGPESGRSSAVGTQPGGEEAVQSVAVRERHEEAGGGDGCRRRRIGRRGDALDHETWVTRREGRYDVGILLAGERADRVDENATGPDERRHPGEKIPLEGRESRNVRRLATPAELGMAAQRAETAARRVYQHCVERAANRCAARVPHECDEPRAKSSGLVADTLHADHAPVERDHEPRLAHARSRVAGLTTRRRANVEHPRTRVKTEQGGYQLGGFALKGEASVAPGGELAEPRAVPLDDDALRRPDARSGGGPRRLELRDERVARRAERV